MILELPQNTPDWVALTAVDMDEAPAAKEVLWPRGIDFEKDLLKQSVTGIGYV